MCAFLKLGFGFPAILDSDYFLECYSFGETSLDLTTEMSILFLWLRMEAILLPACMCSGFSSPRTLLSV